MLRRTAVRALSALRVVLVSGVIAWILIYAATFAGCDVGPAVVE